MSPNPEPRAAAHPFSAPIDIRRNRWRRLAPYLLLGPVSGPLIAGIVFNLRAGRPAMAMIYAAGLVEFVVLLPLVTAHLGMQVL